MPSHQGADSRKTQNQVWLGKYAAQLHECQFTLTPSITNLLNFFTHFSLLNIYVIIEFIHQQQPK